MPEYVTSLLFFLVAMLLAIAPPNVVFSGFASSTLRLVFGGLIVAEAVGATGLLTTNPVQPALLAPLAGELAATMAWPVKAVFMLRCNSPGLVTANSSEEAW